MRPYPCVPETMFSVDESVLTITTQTMPTTGEQKEIRMKVFQVEQRGKQLHHEVLVDEIEVTNSICWSLDGKTMYLANSPSEQIHGYDYDAETGNLSNKTLLYAMRDASKMDDFGCVPDGSVVDAEGYLWNAVWRDGQGPGMVQRIHPPTGAVVFTVHMPDGTSCVTWPCIGGPD